MAEGQKSEMWDLGNVIPEEVAMEVFNRAIRRAQIDESGLVRLEQLAVAMRHLPFLIEEAVIRAREQDATWRQIGDSFHGVTKQATFHRFQYLEDIRNRLRSKPPEEKDVAGDG